MSNSKRQSLIVTGFGLIILSGIILYYALSLPKISNSADVNNLTTVTEPVATTQSVQSQFVPNNNNNDDVANYYQGESSVQNVSYPLNLNTCTIEQLMTIDGIGEVKAVNIIEYRDYLGGYTSVEQIKNIKGIGESVYAKISPYLTV